MKNLNQQQLQMFMKPSELRAMLTDSVDGMDTINSQSDWEEKMTTDLKADIAKQGIHKPVILDHYSRGSVNGVSMGNGHHRVQAAKEIEDSGKEIYIPVMHVRDDYMGNQAAEHFPGVNQNHRANPTYRTW